MPVDRHLERLNAYICFKLLSFHRNLNFSRNCQMVTCIISGSCHHENNLAWVNSFNNICLKNKVPKSNQTRYLGVKRSNASPIFCWPELTRSTIFVSKISWLNRIRHDRLGVETSNASPIFCGPMRAQFSLLILLSFLKICQMVICPVTGTYNHV